MGVAKLIESHRKELIGMEDSARDRLLSIYAKSRDELTAKLVALEAEGLGETFTAQHYAAILVQLNDALTISEGLQGVELRTAFENAVEVGSRQSVSEIAALERQYVGPDIADRLDLFLPTIPAEQVAYLADSQNLLLSKFRDEVVQGVNEQLALSMTNGEGIRKAAARLSTVMDGEFWKLERIARTEINNAANFGHNDTIRQVANDYPELGLKKQWSSNLDGRTSTICTALDRVVVEVSAQFSSAGWSGDHPPAHPNCRSRVNAYSERWGFQPAKQPSKSHAAPCCEEDHMAKKPEHKALGLTIEMKQEPDGSHTFSGLAAAFNNIDSYGDVIERGAFIDTLAEWRTSGKMIPILWQHEPSQVIGCIDPKDLYEDEKGLRFKGAKLVKGVQQADEARALMQAGALGGLSIGYTVMKKGDRQAGDTARRRLTGLKLYEFSPVTWPANEAAFYNEVKSAFSATLEAEQIEQDLWEERWQIDCALGTVMRGLMNDKERNRDQKVAEFADSLNDFSAALLDWFERKLIAIEAEEASGAMGGPEPEELMEGKVLSGSNRKKVEDAIAALTALLEAATKKEGPAPTDQLSTAKPCLATDIVDGLKATSLVDRMRPIK